MQIFWPKHLNDTAPQDGFVCVNWQPQLHLCLKLFWHQHTILKGFHELACAFVSISQTDASHYAGANHLLPPNNSADCKAMVELIINT
eukprot:1873714-Amphidinium_carterae.1